MIVGQGVHYVSYGTPGGEYPSQCRAAIVTEIIGLDQELLGLAVLNPTGLFFDRDIPHDEDGHAGGSWHWPERAEG
jgi:hypothetical protein